MNKSEREYLRKRNRKYRFIVFEKKTIIIFCVIMCLLLSTAFLRNMYITTFNNWIGFNDWRHTMDSAELQVHIIDVGQGDAIAIKFPDNKTMLIDAGARDQTHKLKAYLDNVFFVGREKTFDYVLLTHSDSDHCGGMEMVYKNYAVRNSFRPTAYSTLSIYEDEKNTLNANVSDNRYYKDYIDCIYNELDSEVIINTQYLNYHYYPDGYIVGGNGESKYSITFLTNNKNAYSNNNDNSCVVLLKYANQSLLFTGDSAEEGFNEIDEAIGFLGINDILFYKSAHHGSGVEGCNRDATMYALNPRYVAISVGDSNAYGHPHPSFMQTLELMEIKDNNIMRTDKDGCCVFGVDAENSGNVAKMCKGVPSKMLMPYIWELTVIILGVLAFIICFYNRHRERREYEEDQYI